MVQQCLAIMSGAPASAMCAAGSEDDDTTGQKAAAGGNSPSASAPDSAHVAVNVFVQVGLM